MQTTTLQSDVFLEISFPEAEISFQLL